MVQNTSWEWLIEGFKIDLETQLKPRTIKDYCYHVSYFARWAKDSNILDPHSITKRDIQKFLHFIASTPAIFFPGNGAKRCIQRNENSRWYHYFPLKRFFTWAVKEGYLERNPIDSIELKPLKSAPIEPYKPEHIDAFVKILDYDWHVAKTARQKMLAARDKAVLFLLLDSFIRLGECCQLMIGDIDLKSRRRMSKYILPSGWSIHSIYSDFRKEMFSNNSMPCWKCSSFSSKMAVSISVDGSRLLVYGPFLVEMAGGRRAKVPLHNNPARPIYGPKQYLICSAKCGHKVLDKIGQIR